MELNRGQTLGLNLDMHIVLDAGAGTGKTACIVQRVLEHYLSEDQRATRLLPPGLREMDFSGGLLTTPPTEREDLRAWRGLLPTEVVVLTFTVKAAQEMRDRLRSELARLRPGPRGERDGFRLDPRIRNKGLIEQLNMLLDEAPIGTIDSFLNRLVASHRSLLSTRPTQEQMSDAQRVLLMEKALSSLWRIRNESHAADLGVVSVDAAQFMSARNRLSHQLGGRSRTQRIIARLVGSSLFVDSVRRSLSAHGDIDADSLRAHFLSHIEEGEVAGLADSLHGVGEKWLNAVKECATDLELAAGFAGLTRVRCLDTLIDRGVPSDLWDKLLWIRHFLLAVCSYSESLKPSPGVFPRSILPKGDAWPSGMKGFGSIKDKDAKEKMKAALSDCKSEVSTLFSSLCGMRIRACAEIAELLDPRLGPPHCPADSTVRPNFISDPFPTYIREGRTALSADHDARMVQDLLLVHRAASDVLYELRIKEGVHDHSDVTDAAEDLLLARCPRIARKWYPREMVSDLDRIDDGQPWRDDHIHSALNRADELLEREGLVEGEAKAVEQAKDDLLRRWQTLLEIRRRFRAFIIDEAQDNSNQQWRLLARLWSERERKEGDPDPPDSPWQPTICWVGDQKQSIYGFRQAQVSGMARYTTHLRAINEHEYASESRLLVKPALRRRDSARDPRRVDITSFVTGLEYVNHRPIPEEAWVAFDRGDDNRRLPHQDVLRRSQGHIDLVTNYRTTGDLLETMNEWWVDLFDHRHNLFPGDWYASAKSLRAARSDDKGNLEWLLPIETEQARDPDSDMKKPLDPFSLGAGAKSSQLENALVAARIRALVDGRPTSVIAPMTEPSAENTEMGGEDEQAEQGAPVEKESSDPQPKEQRSGASAEMVVTELKPLPKVPPRDIMVLMPTRTHMDDLVRRLDALGVPALADLEGGLLQQPIVSALAALVQVVAQRENVNRAARLARTPLVGFNDSQLEAYIADRKGGRDLLARLQRHAVGDAQRELFCRWKKLADSNRMMQLLEETLDHSDLLLAHPGAVDRQYAEQFLALVRSQMAEAGGDAILLANRLTKLASVDGKLLPGEAMPPSNAVKVMTIHGSKGLQSKVVVVCGLFSENQSNLGMSYKDNILISGEMFGAKPKPWKSRDEIHSASWKMSSQILYSQVQAEARRQFYVACTRVKDLLILAGGPKNCSLNRHSGSVSVRWDYKPQPRFGWMWLEAMRQAARRDGLLTAPWLLPGDEGMAPPLPSRGNGAIEIPISQMLQDPNLAPAKLKSFPIYHHPDLLLPDRVVHSPLVRFNRLAQSTRLDIKLEPYQAVKLQGERRVRIAPHMLDSANACMRRHWLSHYIGLDSEAINLPLERNSEGGESSQATADSQDAAIPETGRHSATSTSSEESLRLPDAKELGLLFHRLVELGLPNPGVDSGEPTTPLPEHWLKQTDDQLTNPKLIHQVLDEMSSADIDKEGTAALLMEMAEALRQGGLGRKVCAGEESGMEKTSRVEALRTEWPFHIRLDIPLDDVADTRWTPHGERVVQTLTSITFQLDGICDLVLCETDDEGDNTIRAFDLKSSGASEILDPPENPKGSLFEEVQDPLDEEDCNEAERMMLQKHRFQIYLYHLALENQEKMRKDLGIPHRRVVKPAIVVAATGRLITWSDERFAEIAGEFWELLAKLAAVEVELRTDEKNFPRLSGEEVAICHKCPYFIGAVKLCMPANPKREEKPAAAG